ncbi:DUF2922 domain-containing protein [Metabacillus halosaccharovorans]|nr:DUF2922 domain-containing protein [Metabacillus halosaccharovorans]
MRTSILNVEGKTVKVNVDSPIEPVDPVAISAAMDSILTANIFVTSGGEFVSKKGARIVERNMTEVGLS